MQSTSLEHREIAQMKSFLDLVKADGEFRRRVFEEPDSVGVTASLQASDIRALWDPAAAAPPSPVAQEFLDFYEEVKNRLPATPREPEHPRMRVWRERQKARLNLQLGPARSLRLGHYPAVFELSQGCSVGCWFCGISASKLTQVWPYTPENGEFWRRLLTLLREFVGPALAWGFCYWASDPLDNPDYERFAADFHELLGHFPTITTALALKDVERTRRLLQMCRELPSNGLHFSLLGPKQFHSVRQSFGPEELLCVELVPQFANSNYHLAYAGKARRREKGAGFDPNPNTIACVSGFLMNLVERNVRLVTPCPSTPEYPDGYQILAEHRFADLPDLQALLPSLAQDHMRVSVLELPVLKWAHALAQEPLEHGFRVIGPGQALDFCNPERADLMRLLSDLVAEGRHSAEQMGLLAAFQCGASEALTFSILETLFGYGIFEENLG